MFKDVTKLILMAKAATDILREKLESKACDMAIQMKNFTDKTHSDSDNGEYNFKEKAQEELSQFISEISHRVQINELQIKGFIKDKLTELTNNALLDSVELNDIRAEIASLRAEIADLKEQRAPQKR